MIVASVSSTLPLAVFLLSALTIVAKVSRKWGRVGGVLRTVLCVFYALLVVAGVAGLAFSVLLLVAGRGAGMLLILVTVPLSLFLVITGRRLFSFVLSPMEPTAAPLRESSGWSELGQAAERARYAGVAPHLRPEALRKSDRQESSAQK